MAVARQGMEGLTAAEMHDFDAIVLDVMLPALNGFEITSRLRKANNLTPILLLTARDSVEEVVRGLDLGANDYLTKPFAFKELLARLRNVSRQRAATRQSLLAVADLVLDPAARTIHRGPNPISVTPTEYRLLELLMRRAGRVVSRSTIIEAVWGFDRDVHRNTLDVFVKTLRQKIDLDGLPKLIQTVRGFGYSLREAELD